MGGWIHRCGVMEEGKVCVLVGCAQVLGQALKPG